MTSFWTITLFWAIAAALVAIALAFLLPPLLRRPRAEIVKSKQREINIAVYRDQMRELDADLAAGLLSTEQYEAARAELETRLAEDALSGADAADDTPQAVPKRIRLPGYIVAAAVPVAAFGLYFVMGTPLALVAGSPAADAAQAQAGQDVNQMVHEVEERARRSPDDPVAWIMLAKAYVAVERWPDALKAWQNAYRLRPAEPDVLAGYAEALAVSNNRNLAGRPMKLVQQALTHDPRHPKALELAGLGMYQAREFTQAANYLGRLLEVLPPDTPYAADIRLLQQDAQVQAQGGPSMFDQPPPQQSANAPSAAAGARITGSLEVAAALRGKVQPGDVVFLFARAAGGGAPLAALRADAGHLPLNFELNDSQAMDHNSRLSGHQDVVIIARIAKSGDIKGAPGDLESAPMQVKVGAEGVRLVIDRVRP